MSNVDVRKQQWPRRCANTPGPGQILFGGTDMSEGTSASDRRRAAMAAAVRSARGALPQRDVAQRLGVAQGTVSGWESGAIAIGLDHVVAIEDVLDLVRGELLCEA